MIKAKEPPAFSTGTPKLWTIEGSDESDCETLFCVCTCAVSGSVPGSKVSVIVARPAEELSDWM